MICEKKIDVNIEVVSPSTCDKLSESRRYSFSDLAGKHCLYFLHSVFPYRLTFELGGYFRWVPQGEGVITQCCSPMPALETSTRKVNNSIETTVSGMKGQCPHGYSINQNLDLSSIPCEKLVAQLLPIAISQKSKQVSFECQGCKDKKLKGILYG